MRLKGGMTFSLIGHGVVLLWALVSFARPLETMPLDSMPVDIISADEFSKMTAGAEKAPPQPQPKPLVEKIAEAKPVEDLNAKVVEKKGSHRDHFGKHARAEAERARSETCRGAA